MKKNRIAYILLLALGAYLAVLYDAYVSLLVLWLLFIVPLLSGLCLPVWRRMVKVTLQLEDGVVEQGGQGKVVLTVENRSILPLLHGTCELFCKHELDEKPQRRRILFSVDGRGKERVTVSLSCAHCGTISVFSRNVRFVDYFGLFSSKKAMECSQQIAVLPKLSQWTELDTADTAEGEEQETVDLYAEQGVELKEIREYRQGDLLKQIHWKLSSKKGKRMTKVYEREEGERVQLFFHLLYQGEKPDFTWYDTRVKEQLCQCMERLEQQRPHEVVWYDAASRAFFTVAIRREEDVQMVLEQEIRSGIAVQEPEYEQMLSE